jgi:hypothetical protein
MIQHILRTLAGIEQYGILSLCLFGVIFASVFVWAFLQKKSHVERMARVPLDPETDELSNGVNTHE